ncbi:hypothetical protein I6A84_21195 [Frankia sp. CNm7]|uniref:Uncharacterized protein n=2 Tax=Frankia nepalensis TaxID=1836974 RepID=A0A937UVA6_9ACTN|nr:hypothetical protein [Frankia nepalensis]MBL7499051.1 hypothetical protein [Frankia nepalensis]MBL7514509.1 hypothetical protein [Frankia nepalensis]MBL7520535.1 hypothetical protein [Frankia nepalensis]MBL7632041.1 hypothetical protein [Frankia nepalensis]
MLLGIGSGRLPERLRAELAAEGLVLLEEELTGSVTRRRYRAPGEWSSWSKEAASGAIAITAGRLVVWAGRFKHIDVPLAHPIRATIEVVVDRPGRVCFAYDAGTTNPSRSGRVEVRLRTAQAGRVAQLLAADE